jgi:hypothetical protein
LIPFSGRQTLTPAVASAQAPVPTEDITRAILVLRGHRVLLDSELAILYGVTTKRFNEQVRCNAKRFSPDFMFQLSARGGQFFKAAIFATLMLETRLDKKLTTHDEAIAAILSAIRQLMHPSVPERRPIGFTANINEKS